MKSLRRAAWRTARRHSTAARRGFQYLIEHTTVEDIGFLLNLDTLAQNVRQYDAASNSLLPVPGGVPWPVRFALARYHHKHVFDEGLPPSKAGFQRDLLQFERKLLWRSRPLWAASLTRTTSHAATGPFTSTPCSQRHPAVCSDRPPSTRALPSSALQCGRPGAPIGARRLARTSPARCDGRRAGSPTRASQSAASTMRRGCS